MPGMTITNGRVLWRGRIEPGPLYLRDGRVVERPLPGAEQIDARGALVLPGIVDIHGDAFERQIMPRPGVHFDIGLALLDTDRQMLGCGITTAFHGLSVSWEPGLRSPEAAASIVAALRAVRPRLAVDTRLHLRWETFAAEAMEQVLGWLAAERGAILAFNDHTAPMMRDGGTLDRRLAKVAARAGLDAQEYGRLLADRWALRDRVPADIAHMAAAALDAGAVLLAHDEPNPQERARFRALGAVTCEFPLTLETARAARAVDEPVVLGAPNILRGGSHTGAICAAAAIGQGLCTVLASDYFYPAILHAPFRLAAAGILPLADAWALVSSAPAAAAGLRDRGRLDPGQRADVVLVEDEDPTLPVVRLAICAGRVAGAWPG